MRKIIKRDLPNCDFCGALAKYDAPTRLGSWAYMCANCYRKYARADAHILGTELTEKVATDKQLQTKKPDKIKTVVVPLTMDSIADVNCPYCGYSRTVEPDANYTVTCEGCGYKYRIVSML